MLNCTLLTLKINNMKKTILFLFAAAVLTTVTSCKCKTCIKDAAPDVKLCKDDYTTVNDFNDAVAFTEGFGYKCKGSN